jgi:hypothetical protein
VVLGGDHSVAKPAVEAVAAVRGAWHIACEPSVVAAEMTHPANDPDWIGGLREAQLLGEPPVAVRSRVRRVARFLGRRVDYANEILALNGTHVDMRLVDPVRDAHHVPLRTAPDGGTALSNNVRGRGPRLVAPLLRRNVQRDLERLSAVLEGSRLACRAWLPGYRPQRGSSRDPGRSIRRGHLPGPRGFALLRHPRSRSRLRNAESLHRLKGLAEGSIPWPTGPVAEPSRAG